jgi:hypothetical protein
MSLKSVSKTSLFKRGCTVFHPPPPAAKPRQYWRAAMIALRLSDKR